MEAVFEEKSDADGRSIGTPVFLEIGKEYEFIVLSNEKFYFAPAVAKGERYRFYYEYTAANCPDDDHILYVQNMGDALYYGGISYIYEGEPLCFIADYTSGHISRCTYRVKIRIEIV